MRRGPQRAQSLIGRAQQSVKRAGFEKRSGVCHETDCPTQAKPAKKTKAPKAEATEAEAPAKPKRTTKKKDADKPTE
jgi:hypothetical protein